MHFTLLGAREFGAWTPTPDDVLDLLSLLGIGALALPGTLLAWRGRGDEVESD